MRFFWVSFLPSLLFAAISSDLNVGLRALQQIRTLIPERLTTQEFSIIVDREAFIESFKQTPSHFLNETDIPPMNGICCSQGYYTHWTISGEPVRILDDYQQFEYGPFWLYPSAVQRLYEMDHRIITDSSK